jgi:hypothetical protein
MDSWLRVSKAASLCGRIIRERSFGDRSREVGYECVRLLIRGLDPWPDRLAEEIRRTLQAFEEGSLDEQELESWIDSWAAAAEREDELDEPRA